MMVLVVVTIKIFYGCTKLREARTEVPVTLSEAGLPVCCAVVKGSRSSIAALVREFSSSTGV